MESEAYDMNFRMSPEMTARVTCLYEDAQKVGTNFVINNASSLIAGALSVFATLLW